MFWIRILMQLGRPSSKCDMMHLAIVCCHNVIHAGTQGIGQVWVVFLLWQWENSNFPFTPILNLPLPTALMFCLFPLFTKQKIRLLYCNGGPECFIEKIYPSVHLLIHWIILPDSCLHWFQWNKVLRILNVSDSYIFFCRDLFVFTQSL